VTNLWGFYWLVAAVVVVFVVFGIPEYLAIRRGNRGIRYRDTLSEQVWWIRQRIGRVGVALIFGPFLLWLFVHFVWGGN
jgi:hypothetical protein